MNKLHVYRVALGVMRHLETASIQLRRRPPKDEQGNVRNM
jgi:hypothetical protein